MITVTTSATWKPEPRGKGFENVTGAGTDHVAWGAPDAEKRQSGYTFTGHTTEVPLDGHEFTVGTITYDNYQHEPGTGHQYHHLTLHLSVRLSVRGGEETVFPFAFTHYSFGDEEGDVPDTLSVPMPFPGSQTLTLDGTPYALILCGFPHPADGPLQNSASGPEGHRTTFELLGMLVRTDRPDIAIRSVHHQGERGRPQDGEYVEIVNRGGAMIPIKGWTVNAGDSGQNYTFTGNGYLAPGMTVRIYTSDQQQPPGWYGLSFQSKRPIWNDKGDTAELRDHTGTLRAKYAYGNAADEAARP
ncbi:lamin tail domain-containing protein [Streptomyces sp. MNP-20]|uniref:lamin tail domain-containing protein n=1 Tax=Streptomyces sp. MNP-20 TaxID=2721165 RepID=UPI001C1E7891|nr:lamin tail domain-containing protein [Streptomyces sp. MNP-20]